MKCIKCNNDIIIGKKFCGFCGMKNIDINEKSSVLEELKMEGGSNKATNKKSPIEKLFISIFLVIFIIIPIGWSIWYDATKPPDVPRCKEIQKEKQVITKLDGGITSVTTETVNGCEYPDGSFLEYPN